MTIGIKISLAMKFKFVFASTALCIDGCIVLRFVVLYQWWKSSPLPHRRHSSLWQRSWVTSYMPMVNKSRHYWGYAGAFAKTKDNINVFQSKEWGSQYPLCTQQMLLIKLSCMYIIYCYALVVICIFGLFDLGSAFPHNYFETSKSIISPNAVCSKYNGWSKSFSTL